MARVYGVYRPEGYSERAILIIDRAGIVRYIDIHKIGEAPPVEETLRILRELE